MARNFNGTSAYLEGDEGASFNIPITLAAWVRVDAVGSSQAVMAFGNGVSRLEQLGIGTTGAVFAFSNDGLGGGSGTANSSGSVTVATWAHACAVFAFSDDRRAFLNGRHKGTDTTLVSAPSFSKLTIGTRYSDGMRGQFFDGLIAEAAYWNVGLTDAEVALLGQGYSPRVVRPGSLRAYWPLAGQYSPTEPDVVARVPLAVNAATPWLLDQPPLVGRRPRARALDLAFPLTPPDPRVDAKIIFRAA
jgi:hypothetical protein